MRFFIQFLPALCLLAAHFCAYPVTVLAQSAVKPSEAAPLRVAVSNAAKQLDPALAVDAASARLLMLTHPALLQFDAQYNPVGLVAESCTQPDTRRVVCKLPQGRAWVDGKPMTAAEVGEWFRAIQANPRSPLQGLLKNVEKIEAPDVRTLVLGLAKPQAEFAGVLVQVPIARVGDKAGAGPYRVTDVDVLNTVTLVTKRTDIPSKVEIIPVQDHTVRMMKLMKGDVDVLYNDLPPEIFTYAKQQGFGTASTPGTSYGYLLLNWRDDLLSQYAVRKALTYGMDRALIRKTLLAGLAEPASTILPQGHPLAWNAPEEKPDAQLGNELLEEGAYLLADTDGMRTEMTLTTSTDALSQRVAQALQYQLRGIGIDLKLRPMEWGGFFAAVQNGQTQLALMAWTGEQTPDFYYRIFNSSQVPPAGFNRGAVKDAELNTLTQAYMDTSDTVERARLAKAIQERQAQVLPYIPLYRRHHTLVMGKDVYGCSIPANGALNGLLGCKKR